MVVHCIGKSYQLKSNSHPKYINNQQTHFNMYDIFYSQCSHQHVSASIVAIFRVMLILQEHKQTNKQTNKKTNKQTNLVNCITINPKQLKL